MHILFARWVKYKGPTEKKADHKDGVEELMQLFGKEGVIK